MHSTTLTFAGLGERKEGLEVYVQESTSAASSPLASYKTAGCNSHAGAASVALEQLSGTRSIGWNKVHIRASSVELLYGTIRTVQ